MRPKPCARRLFSLTTALTTILTLSACKTTTESAAPSERRDAAGDTPSLKMCAGIRGNGDLIFAHFASLARITEHYGLVDAAAGGSSASITIFLYESMLMHPKLRQCGAQACTPRQIANRLALLLKSVEGYALHIGDSDEAVALRYLAPILAKVTAAGIPALFETDVPQAVKALLTVLRSQDLASLINPELITLLTTSKDPAYHARQILASLQALGNWSVDDPAIFIRPGAINFEALATMTGRIGSFYAGYAPANADAMEHFLNTCAEPARGQSWSDIAQLPASAIAAPTATTESTTCGAVFDQMLGNFRSELVKNPSYRSRVDDTVGKTLPTLVSTSILEGPEAMAAFQSARTQFANSQAPTLAMKFENIRFGYWGQNADLAKVGANPREFSDMKTSKFLALGETSWRTALSYSPAEPSLSRILEISPERASAGGWSDLQPTLVLKNLGCENVIYVTRRGDESPFAVGVAKNLGLGAAEKKALYDLESDAQSSFSLSLANASVWCTNWNAYGTTQFQEIFSDSYNAPLELRTSALTASDPYSNATTQVGQRGCSIGTPAPPAQPQGLNLY